MTCGTSISVVEYNLTADVFTLANIGMAGTMSTVGNDDPTIGFTAGPLAGGVNIGNCIQYPVVWTGLLENFTQDLSATSSAGTFTVTKNGLYQFNANINLFADAAAVFDNIITPVFITLSINYNGVNGTFPLVTTILPRPFSGSVNNYIPVGTGSLNAVYRLVVGDQVQFRVEAFNIMGGVTLPSGKITTGGPLAPGSGFVSTFNLFPNGLTNGSSLIMAKVKD